MPEADGRARSPFTSGSAEKSARRTYGVKIVRGPVVNLAPHDLKCADEDELLALAGSLERPLAADLFCGAGGLSLGLQAAGFDVVVGVDTDTCALETHASLFPGLTLNRDLLSDDAVEEVIGILSRLDLCVLAGGPPCQPFSRAGRSKIRSLVEAGARQSHDKRSELWQAFVEIVEAVQPPAVLLENVPDMALGDDMVVLRTIIDRLEALGYGVHVRLLDAWRYGVPQHRQRLIVVALSEGCDFEWPKERTKTVTVWDAIGDLPPVKGGWRPTGGAEGYVSYRREPRHWFQKKARAGRSRESRQRVYDHITRPVRPDDAEAFALMRPGSTYAELDARFKRYRDDIFDDKYKRLHPEELSRTITAHISRDGYWYIHPYQPRTLTVREAARLQTFHDRARFAGPPSAAFRQIGNAVPPLLAEAVGRQILQVLENPSKVKFGRFLVTEELAAWYQDEGCQRRPWLDRPTGWSVVMGELALSRASSQIVGEAWPRLARFGRPEDVVEDAEGLRSVVDGAGRGARAGVVIAAAEWLVSNPADLRSSAGLRRAPGVTAKIASLAGLAALGEDQVIASSPVLRTAARFWGSEVDRVNRNSHGRMAVGLMLGGGDLARDAHLGLIELADEVCRPADPCCARCPLSSWCAYASSNRC